MTPATVPAETAPQVRESDWTGPVMHHVAYWRARALAAEQEVQHLRGLLYVARQAWVCVTRLRP